MYIYNARTTDYLNISTGHLLLNIKGIKDTEKKLSKNDTKRKTTDKKMGKCFNKLIDMDA